MRRHLHACCRAARVPTWQEVAASAPVAPATTQLECARRADGGAAVIVCSEQFLSAAPAGVARRAVSIDGAPEPPCRSFSVLARCPAHPGSDSRQGAL
jgi:hypothetical protein